MRIVRAAAYLGIVYIACFGACFTNSRVFTPLFLIAYYGFGLILLGAIYGAAGMVLIKWSLALLRNIKKILRRIKK
jgi:hypothetical protein